MKKIVMLMMLVLPAGAHAFINQITKLNSDPNRQLAFCGKSYNLTGVTSCSSSAITNLLAQIRTDYGTFGIQYNPQTGQYNANVGNGYDPNYCDCPAPYILTPNSLVVSCTNHVTGSINGQPNITGVMVKIQGGCSQRPPPPPPPSDAGTPSCTTTTWQHAGIVVSNFTSTTYPGQVSMQGLTTSSHTNQFADCAAARSFTDAWITANYSQIVQIVTQAATSAGACPAGTVTQVADKNTILNRCIPSPGSNPTGDLRFRVWNYPVPVTCCI